MTNTEFAPNPNVVLRYTVTLRPSQKIDLDWIRVAMNDLPGLGDTVWHGGEEYKVASYRKNF